LNVRFGRVGKRFLASGGGFVDVERNARDRLKRAQRKVRQYVVANRLDRFLTLTFEDFPWSVAEAIGQVERFFRRVR